MFRYSSNLKDKMLKEALQDNNPLPPFFLKLTLLGSATSKESGGSMIIWNFPRFFKYMHIFLYPIPSADLVLLRFYS